MLLFVSAVVCLPSLSCGTSVLKSLRSPERSLRYLGLWRAGLGLCGISVLLSSHVVLMAGGLILTEHFASKR